MAVGGSARYGLAREDWGTYGQEDEDVTLGLGRVNLKDGGDRRVEVVRFGLGCVENVDGVATTGN